MSAAEEVSRGFALRLWHRPGSRSRRVLWLLEELGVPYELEVLTRQQSRGAEHRRRHPLGRVPVLEWDGTPVFESVAVCLALADAHPAGGLLARRGPARAWAMQWSVFAAAEIDSRVLLAMSLGDRQSAGPPAPVSEALDALSAALADGDHLSRERFSVADLLCATGLQAISGFGLTPLDERLSAWLAELERRPAWRRVQTIDAAHERA